MELIIMKVGGRRAPGPSHVSAPPPHSVACARRGVFRRTRRRGARLRSEPPRGRGAAVFLLQLWVPSLCSPAGSEVAPQSPDHRVLAERLLAGGLPERRVRGAPAAVPPADFHTDRRGKWPRPLGLPRRRSVAWLRGAGRRPPVSAPFSSPVAVRPLRPGCWLPRIFLRSPCCFCLVPFLFIRTDAKGFRCVRRWVEPPARPAARD